MQSRILDNITGLFELDLPSDLKTLEEHVEYIIPLVQRWSEDLYEEHNYVNKRWVELRDTDTYQETVLHIFMPAGEYMVSIDGDITKGTWRYLKESNTFIVDYGGKSQLFDLVFLNGDFFILSKHGDQERKGRSKHFVYINESTVGGRGLDWRNAMEELFNIYRQSSRFSIALIVIMAIVLILAVFYFS
jgi:hypothetical protein